MSSIPLISHHLFVAAVNEKTGAAGMSASEEPLGSVRDIRSIEVPLEVVKFSHSLAGKTCKTMSDPRPEGSP